jgi:hypothetical protein
LVDGSNESSLEEHLYLLISNIIKATKEVDQFELQIFSILPKTFYRSKGRCGFSTSFHLLQSIIFFGGSVLARDEIVVRNLILLSLESINPTTNSKPRNESDCLEGLFILQSLAITVGRTFKEEVWIQITRCLTNKIRSTHIVFDFVKGR